MLFETYLYILELSLLHSYNIQRRESHCILVFGRQSEIQCVVGATSKSAVPLAWHRLAGNKTEIKMGIAAPIPQLVTSHQCLPGVDVLGKGKRSKPFTHGALADTMSFPTEGELLYQPPLSQLAFKVIAKHKAVEFLVG